MVSLGTSFFLEFQSANTVFLPFCCLLVLVGILLQHCHLFPRFSSSYMLVWMPWILRSGKLLAKGDILKLVFAIILLSPFQSVDSFLGRDVSLKYKIECTLVCWFKFMGSLWFNMVQHIRLGNLVLKLLYCPFSLD